MAGRTSKRLNPRGITLRRTFEQRALERMIDRLDETDESVEGLCKLVHVYCELLRQDAAADKANPAPDRAASTDSPHGEPAARPADRVSREAAVRETVSGLYGIDAAPAAGDRAMPDASE